MTKFQILPDGSVEATGPDFHEMWRPWGHPSGFGVHGCARDEPSGMLTPRLLNQVLREPASRIPAALRPLAMSIPEEVRAAVYPIVHYEVELLQLAEVETDAFLQLRRTNPALLLLVAEGLGKDLEGRAKKWGSLLTRRQTAIMREFGYPGSWAKLLRKIQPTSMITRGLIHLALEAFSRPHMARILSHAPALSFDTVLLAHRYPEAVAQCPSLISESLIERAYSTAVFDRVERIYELRNSMGHHPIWPYRHISLDTLVRACARLEQRAMEQGADILSIYPCPPVLPDDQWAVVTNSRELQEFAEAFQNCAVTMHWRLTLGIMAIYYTRTDPDPICVVLERSQGTWQVSDVLGEEDALVEPERKEVVSRHFEETLE